MTPSFKFLIDKEANFTYWAQLIIGRWCWYFQSKNFEFFKKNAGDFSETEQNALNKFKFIVQKEENQFLWLWKRYDGQPILDKVEAENYQYIRTVLNSKFELVWAEELPKLKNWQMYLESYKFQNLDNVFYKIIKFLENQNIKKSINIKLMLGSYEPAGATRSDFENLIILNISSVPNSCANRIIGILMHEFAHLINNKNKVLERFSQKSFFWKIFIKNIFHIKKIKLKNNYRWKYLFTETVLKSIASHRSNNYLGELLDFSKEERIKDKDLSHKKLLREYSYEFIIRIAASQILDETKKYFENNQTVDQKYMNKIGNIWADILNELQNPYV